MPYEFIIPFADDGHEEGDPPSREEIAFDDAIDHIRFNLWKMTLGHVSPSFEMPLVLRSIRSFRPAFQLDGKRRDQIINDIFGAAAAAADRLPKQYSRHQIAIAMSAAAIVVSEWAATGKERARQHPHKIDDAKMWIRMFERDMRNMSDYEYLQSRKLKRGREADTRQKRNLTTFAIAA
ncbi:hypothetical protein [Mesorhizobium sp. INR15]|uniref:hypothetical protein n=1 Tax=Mesorhizobium sp. INR15 TaxID=2654248 RepID=UPI001896965C|nr:hypothetical protein [Mesorhizobium sp. INR15]QPC90013.1 hypothetical protein GA829_05080 [Mesorhizobium sp. INR15]